MQLNGAKSLTPLTLPSLILIVKSEHADSSISDICRRVIEEKKEFYYDEGRKIAAAQRKKMTLMKKDWRTTEI